MKKYVTLFLAAALLPLAGCTSTGTTDIYAAAGEPHVLLSYPSPSELRGDFFPAVLMRVDGRSMRDAQRQTFRLIPGEHEIRLRPTSILILKNLPKSADERKVPGRFREKPVTVTLEAGKHYIFGARIREADYDSWEPIVREREAR